jgi:hypothetical protein
MCDARDVASVRTRVKLTIVTTLLVLTASAAAAPVWEAGFSKVPVTATEAESYCAALGPGWRLPVRAELESLGVDDRGTPRKGAPKLPADGYLWSGEDVNEARKGQRWIMNLGNGHIFNGGGKEGYAKCVKGPAPAVVEHALPPGYLFIGPDAAKLTIVTAMQLDYVWTHKARVLIEDMLAKHSVRFELHAYWFDEKYIPTSIAVCAVGRENRFTAFEAKHATRKKYEPLTAPELRELALEAGVKAAAYDHNVKKVCPALVKADGMAFDRKVEAAPTFFVGDQKVAGADPAKLEAAIQGALTAK